MSDEHENWLSRAIDWMSDDLPVKLAVVMGVGALLVAVLVAAPYALLLGGEISRNPSDWATFGDYFGGVAGPLFAMLGVFSLVLTIIIQHEQSTAAQRRAWAEQHLRSLAELAREIERLEERKLTESTTLGNILDGLHERLDGESEKRFQQALEQYLTTLGSYSQTVAMYRDNVVPHWDVQTFERRGLDLLNRVAPHCKPNGMAQIGLHIMRGQLENTIETGSQRRA